MRQVREVLRLTTAGVGLNEIARRVGVASSTVRLTLKRLASAGFSWPLPAEMSDSALEAALFAAAGTKQGHRRHAEPDWAEIHRELKRKHVTLTILWDEYIERCPEGYRYSRFCELYRGWALRLSVTMRQAHIGGDKLFVDYAGDTVPVIIDRLTGHTRPAQIFVAVMGASNFTPAFAGAGSTPRRAGLRHWPTGSPPIPEPSQRSAACPTCWCRTTPKSPSSRPASTSRRSIEPTPRWRPTTIRRSCRHGRAGRATRRRLHTAPHSETCTVMGTSRAGRGAFPPQPLRMVWSGGSCQRPRFNSSW